MGNNSGLQGRSEPETFLAGQAAFYSVPGNESVGPALVSKIVHPMGGTNLASSKLTKPFPGCLGTALGQRQGRREVVDQTRSTPSFLTLDFQTLSPNQDGPFAGAATCSRQPVKLWTRFVPRSRRDMVVWPREAAFRAAPRGCREANTMLESVPECWSTKYFLSAMFSFLCGP